MKTITVKVKFKKTDLTYKILREEKQKYKLNWSDLITNILSWKLGLENYEK